MPSTLTGIAPALLTREEAADYLSVSISTLWRLRDDGDLPYVKIKGKILFRREDLDSFITANIQTA